MIELDGIEYRVQTPEENATAMVQYINDYCNSNGITNTKGETIYVEANRTNPLYMIIFGLGYLVSVMQKLLYSVGCGYNIAASSTRQLLNLADIAGVRRRGASKTSISCVIYASPYGPCEITTSLVAQYSVGGTTIEFSPAFNVTIQPNRAAHVPLIANIYGAYSIEAGVITQFSTPVENMDHIESLASIPGTTQESIADLRNRLQNRVQAITQIDKATDAIRRLDGVTTCAIYYNYSNTESHTVGGIEVEPRKALVVVQGYSPDIAKTFFSYLLAETVAGPADRNVTQIYTTHAGQEITVNFVAPRTLDAYIRIYSGDVLTDETIQAMKYAVAAMAGSLEVAQEVSAAQIITAIQNAVPSVNIRGAQIGPDSTHYSYLLTPDSDQLITFNLENILVEGVQQ